MRPFTDKASTTETAATESFVDSVRSKVSGRKSRESTRTTPTPPISKGKPSKEAIDAR